MQSKTSPKKSTQVVDNKHFMIYEAIEFCDGSNAEIMLAIDSSTTVNTPFHRTTFRAYGDCDERPIPNTFS